jgi:hypothetical protein
MLHRVLHRQLQDGEELEGGGGRVVSLLACHGRMRTGVDRDASQRTVAQP